MEEAIFLGVTAVVWIRGDAVRSGLVEARRQRELRARQAVADERTRIAGGCTTSCPRHSG